MFVLSLSLSLSLHQWAQKRRRSSRCSFCLKEFKNLKKKENVFSLSLALSLGGFENDLGDKHAFFSSSTPSRSRWNFHVLFVHLSSNSQEHGRCFLCIKKSKYTAGKRDILIQSLSLSLSQRLQKLILPGHVLSGQVTSKMSFLTPDGLSVQISSNVWRTGTFSLCVNQSIFSASSLFK